MKPAETPNGRSEGLPELVTNRNPLLTCTTVGTDAVEAPWDQVFTWLRDEKHCIVAQHNYTRNFEVRCPLCDFQFTLKIRRPQPIRELVEDLRHAGCTLPDWVLELSSSTN